MSKLRQMSRNIAREKEKARFAHLEQKFNEMPEHCVTCKEKLDVKNKDHLDGWMVVQDTLGGTALFCSTCYPGKKDAS